MREILDWIETELKKALGLVHSSQLPAPHIRKALEHVATLKADLAPVKLPQDEQPAQPQAEQPAQE